MISLIIPCIDNHEITKKAIDYARVNATQNIEIIIIDNNSEVPYTKDNCDADIIISEKENLGVPLSILKASDYATHEILVFIHNDVYIHEYGWNDRIVNEFENKPKLGVAGFFGAIGVAQNGARLSPMSNMLGYVAGSKAAEHGLELQTEMPAATLDGLCIIIKKEIVGKLGLSELPPHHWYDRIIPLEAIRLGFWVETIGIGFDHDTGATAGKSQYQEQALKWIEDNGYIYDSNFNIDQNIYNIGEKIFKDKYENFLPLMVDSNFIYHWSK